MNLKAWYLYNSAFVVKTESQCFIFDYYPYPGEPVGATLADRGLNLNEIKEFGLPVTVFASHSHPDHFDRCIYAFGEVLPNLTYVLSKDIFTPRALAPETFLMVKPGQTYEWNGLTICTLRSTDKGVAFLIRTPEGDVIYHGGDLNFWDWSGESAEYRAKMERDYKSQIDLLRGEKIDLAFVPLDGRLEENYWKGLDYFMRTTDTSLAVPMHFREQYEVFDWLKVQPEAQEYLGRIQLITP